MKLLIAEDDVLFQRVLAQILAPRYEIVLARTGSEAWEILQRPDAPKLAVLDWVMPGLTGPEICRKVRADERLRSMYLIIVTSKNNEADIVAGLRAGADDYITKPPVNAELLARIRVGERVLSLQQAVEAQDAASRPVFAGDSLIRNSRTDVRSRKAAGREKPVENTGRPSESLEQCENDSGSYETAIANVGVLSSLERLHCKG